MDFTESFEIPLSYNLLPNLFIYQNAIPHVVHHLQFTNGILTKCCCIYPKPELVNEDTI